MGNNAREKRISLLSASLRGGGAERATVTLANCFAQRGYKVDLVLISKEGPYLSELSEQVRLIDLKKKRVILALPALAGYLRKEKPLFLISSMSHVNVLALLARWITGVKTKLIIREVTVIYPDADGQSINARGFVIKILMSIFYPVADWVIAVSQGVADDLISCFKVSPKKLRVIYDPVVTEELLNKAHEPVTHQWFTKKEMPIILAAGRLSREKDFPTLLKAFSILISEKDLRLVIIGDGTERDKLESIASELNIQEEISMPGFANNPYSYMKQADVVVVTSIFEGLSNVLVQAMAVGTPVVSTNCPSGPAEVLENGKYGPLVPVGDPDVLAQAILNVLNNPLQPDFLMAGAERFSAQKICDQYLQLFNSSV